MICPNCKQEYEGNFCSNCGYSPNAPQPAVVIQQVPQKKKNSGCLIALIIPAAVIVAFIIAVNISKSDEKKSSSQSDSLAISEEIITNSPATTTAKTDSKSETTTTAKETTTEITTAPEEELTEESYESNSYYDIVEQGAYRDLVGYTHIVQKVQAKKSGTVEGTMIVYSPKGSVIGKAEDTIYLAEGGYNYFEYYFDADLTDAKYTTSVKTKNSLTHDGDDNAVEMVEYSISPEIIGAKVYVTFKQVGKIGAFSQYKLIFYKGDQIVSTTTGHFSVYASNLTGAGSTDVAEIMTDVRDFDRVEYIYEK